MYIALAEDRQAFNEAWLDSDDPAEVSPKILPIGFDFITILLDNCPNAKGVRER